ncbi:MAG: serine/threonine-protein kinase [Gammaproteobacteria bacterium]|nr:serine/threonine-protein kinase [Gammaproteobacteria bacterium]
MDIPGYIIQKEIGRGGMATVYLAIQESLDRSVALKILDAIDMDTSDDLTERFLAEGRIVASLDHPNIITIYDIGIADNTLYISMEYIQGGDLKQRLELSFSSDEALDYLNKIANALSEAHKRGIIHRDVKPANILFKDETPVLTDFGIAKQVDIEMDLTSTGIFLGSPNYVSPEQADGLKLDGRADIYSLGCIFYEMLTGKKPYISDSVINIVIQHKQAPIPTLPVEYKEFQPLLNRMLAKKREERFADADSLVTDIERLQHSRNALLQAAGIDITGSGPRTIYKLRQKRSNQILLSLILLSMVVFSSLKYVEIRIKDTSIKTDNISTSTVLGHSPVILADIAAQSDQNSVTIIETSTKPDRQPANEEVSKALIFLGKQSLAEYKLTYPPKNNAYYYFSRLLQLNPGNQHAINGIFEISERYSILAEQSLANNEPEKTLAYVDIGLRINPENEALLAIKSFVQSQDSSLLTTFKSLFSSK